MEPEAIPALERRVAEALEPMLDNTDGDWVKQVDGRSEFYSKNRLWQYERTSHDYSTGEWVPRPIGTDGNAMLALIAAMLRRGFRYEARSSSGSSSEFHYVEFIWTGQDGFEVQRDDAAATLPLAVLLTAAKALGVEEEKTTEGA